MGIVVGASVVVCSCWGGGKGADTPAPRAPALTVEAEHLLAIAERLDYEAPRRSRRFDARNKAAELYRQACEQRSDVSACVWAVSLMVGVADADRSAEARVTATTDILASMCLDKQDDAACRAFDAVDVQSDRSNFSNANALCERGLAEACRAALIAGNDDADNVKLGQRACALGDPDGCAALKIHLDDQGRKDESAAIFAKQREAEEARCARGFGISCALAASVSTIRPATSDTPAKSARAARALADGCKRGYLFECEWSADADNKETVDMVARACTLTGRSCTELATMRRERNDGAMAVRDALEHGCQFRVYDDCIDVVKGYRAKEYPEPVRNRAEAIIAYWCTEGTPGYSEAVCAKFSDRP
jgi:hypothetical protein